MPTAWNTHLVEFRGGLISNLSPLQQGINQIGSATILQNFEPSLSGGYKKVLGYEKFSDTVLPGSGNVQGVCVVPEVGSTTVIAIRDGVYYQGSGTTWTSKATASQTSFSKARFTKYNFDGFSRIAFVDGANYPAYYDTDGDTVTFLSSGGVNDQVQGAEHVANFKNSIFYALNNDVFFTAPFTDDDLDPINGAGQINVGSAVTGLIAFREQLIIFCLDRILRLVGNTVADFALQPITEDIGCIESGTIQEVGGDIIFMGPDGLRTLSATDRFGDFGLDVASKPIQDTYTTFKNNASSFSSLVIPSKAQYRIFGFSSTERQAVARGLLATKFVDQGGSGLNWSELRGFKVFVSDAQSVGTSDLVVFANEDGYVYRMEFGSSRDGENLDGIYESPFMPINDPQIRKTFYKFVGYIDPEGPVSLQINLKFDQGDSRVVQPPAFEVAGTGTNIFLYGSPTATFGTSTFGGELDNIYSNNVIGSGKTVAIRLEDRSTNASFTLDTVVLEYAINDRQ